MSNIEKLNQLQADALVMYTKLHNYHWNVKGIQFYGLHEKTETFYTHFSVLYDDLAERILQLGSKPLVTMKAILEKTNITEESSTSFSASEVVDNIHKDFSYFLKNFKELSSISENDSTTQAFADEQTAFLEKEIWMLNSLKGE